MSKILFWFLPALYYFFDQTSATDQVMVHTFEHVLLDHGKQWIVELTYNFNDQETLEDARNVTLAAIDNNWKPVVLVPVCAGEGAQETVMNPLNQVKENAESFINYREALKSYIEKLLERMINTNIVDSSEIEKIREIFWEVELKHQTIFEQVKVAFFEKIIEMYSEDVLKKLEVISDEVVAADSFISDNFNYR